jgi:hypothetical protein
MKQSKSLVPMIDLKTTWNSTFDMLTRAVKYKQELALTYDMEIKHWCYCAYPMRDGTVLKN